MLKRFIISGSYVIPPPPPEPRDYYISSAGVGNGLTSGTPAPLSTFLSATKVSGDRLFPNRGDTFYISDLSLSGLDDIEITPYGSGADPIFTGAISLTAATWNDNGDGTWWTSLADEPKWVWINGLSARLAESSWYLIDSAINVSTRSIAAATLAGLSSIVGAKVIFKQFNFRATEVSTVLTEDDSTGNFTFSPSLADNGYAIVGLGCKFMNQAQFMTTAGDWWYDNTNEKLYIKSVATPAGTDIAISTGLNGINALNCENLTIDNIEFRNYSRNPLDLKSVENSSVTNCTIRDYRGSGIRLYGTSLSVDLNDNLIERGALRGIEHAGTNGLNILRNTITDTGVGDNIGYPYDENLTGGSAITIMGNVGGPSTPSNVIISENTMLNSGYQCVQHWGPTFQITKNIMTNYMLRWNDGGAIHTIYRAGLISSTSGGLIEKNIITNGVGYVVGTTHAVVCEGIYIDNGCNANTVNDNTVQIVTGSAILFNWDTKQNTVTNNKCTGFATYGIKFVEDTDPADSPVWPNNISNICTGNIIGVRNTVGKCVDATSLNNLTTYNPFSSGGSSDNNHYVNPYLPSIGSYHQNTTATTYTLSQWQTKMGLDAASTERTSYLTFSTTTNALQEVKVETNPTNAAVDFNVPAGYSDYAGVAFSNPVSIAAYSSLIYFKDTNFP